MVKRKNLICAIILVIILNLFCVSTAFATSNNTTYITLSDNTITVNDDAISSSTSANVYLTNSMDNGGTSEDATKANIEITNIININSSGTYEFTGDLSDGQIAINSNKVKGDVTIILNNTNITCKNAPAIFVYNSQTNSSTCNVTIKTASGTTNTIYGGKIKQSVEGWSDQTELLYYVDKGYDDDNQYYERYKYDGAISADISLTFEGEGTLTVNALKKEGIESKKDITINSGNYIINSLDDGINACTDNESVITINGGNVLVNVQSEAEEGDGIDSNGYIYINGGAVYAFACESSQDNGLDSDCGTYINGGAVVATGNMADSVSTDSKQEFMQLQFNSKVEKDTLITITDENKSPIVAFKADRTYAILTISTSEFTSGEHYVYEGGSVNGTSENGLYTQISSYTLGTEKEYSTTSDIGIMRGFNGEMKNMNVNNNSVYICTLAVLFIILVICIFAFLNLKKKENFEMKGKALTLIIGILIGAIISTVGFLVYNNISKNSNQPDMMQMDKGQMDGDFQGKDDNGKGGGQNGDMSEPPSKPDESNT